MESDTLIIKISKYVATILLCFALLGLLFRATLYQILPVEPGEPAGLGDVIELFLYFTILGIAGLTLVLSVIIAVLKNYKGATRVFLFGGITPVAYHFLHSFVSRFM